MPDMLLMVSKIVLWLVVVVVATLLLRNHQASARIRLWFLIAGVLVFGFVYGFVVPGSQNPNPPLSVRGVLAGLLTAKALLAPMVIVLLLLLVTVFVSNKTICGWGCPFGLLQDLLSRAPLPRWRPPFWMSNAVRVLAFVGLVVTLVGFQLDWITFIDPFRLFNFDLTPLVIGFLILLLGTSLFIYRPWCMFLCPFGLVSWLVEQVSIMRPRVRRETCKACGICVKACPTGAMEAILDGRHLHPDCFACGACLNACPTDDALEWRGP